MLVAVRTRFAGACFGLEVVFAVFLRVVAMMCVGYQKPKKNTN
jgi:hypothetical protein